VITHLALRRSSGHGQDHVKTVRRELGRNARTCVRNGGIRPLACHRTPYIGVEDSPARHAASRVKVPGMPDKPRRVAVYYAPAPEDPLWAACCSWLGRDPERRIPGEQPKALRRPCHAETAAAASRQLPSVFLRCRKPGRRHGGSRHAATRGRPPEKFPRTLPDAAFTPQRPKRRRRKRLLAAIGSAGHHSSQCHAGRRHRRHPPRPHRFAFRYFNGRQEHRVIANAGHTLPQENPTAFLEAILTIRAWQQGLSDRRCASVVNREHHDRIGNFLRRNLCRQR
jgi:pimeloyl-ACP methyl ester carboxylesterase